MVKNITISGKKLLIIEVLNGDKPYTVHIQNDDVVILPHGAKTEYYENRSDNNIKGVSIF